MMSTLENERRVRRVDKASWHRQLQCKDIDNMACYGRPSILSACLFIAVWCSRMISAEVVYEGELLLMVIASPLLSETRAFTICLWESVSPVKLDRSG